MKPLRTAPVPISDAVVRDGLTQLPPNTWPARRLSVKIGVDNYDAYEITKLDLQVFEIVNSAIRQHFIAKRMAKSFQLPSEIQGIKAMQSIPVGSTGSFSLVFMPD